MDHVTHGVGMSSLFVVKDFAHSKCRCNNVPKKSYIRYVSKGGDATIIRRYHPSVAMPGTTEY